MLALQLQAPSRCIMGFGEGEGAPDVLTQKQKEAETARVREQLYRIRRRLFVIGLPTAVAGGALTTIIFGAAFKLAQTSKAWTPALVIGGATALAGIARVVVAASSVASLEAEVKNQA